jgi:hypothetical protein
MWCCLGRWIALVVLKKKMDCTGIQKFLCWQNIVWVRKLYDWAALLSSPAGFLKKQLCTQITHVTFTYKHWQARGANFSEIEEPNIWAQFPWWSTLLQPTAGVTLSTCLVKNMQGFLYSRRTKQSMVISLMRPTRLSSRRHRTPLF